MGGLFLFNHDCCTTIAIQIHLLRDLYTGPVYPELKMNMEGCPGYCSDKYNFKPCKNNCQATFVRQILIIVQNWPKS